MIILKNRETAIEMPCMVWRDENDCHYIVRWRSASFLGATLAVLLPADVEEWKLWEADEAAVKGLLESGYPWDKAEKKATGKVG